MTSQGQDLTFAVAYWGEGAAEKLGLLDCEKKIRIALNVEHGGTNPFELDTLRSNPSIEVRVHPQLHAKIFASKENAIVGSANASKNGLHWDETGHVEAAVLVEGAAAQAAKELASEIFEDSRPVTDKDIKMCRERFGRVSMAQHLSAAKRKKETLSSTTLNTLMENDQVFGKMPFIISEGEPEAETYKKDLKKVKSSLQDAGMKIPAFLKNPAYFEGLLHKDYVDEDCLEIHERPNGTFALHYVRPLPLEAEHGTFARKLKLSDTKVFPDNKENIKEFTEKENEQLSRALKNMGYDKFYEGWDIFQKLREQMS